ncbi:MAG: septum site-determining protein MinC [Chloroflexota bacterium]
MNATAATVQIKGFRDSLLVVLNGETWEGNQAALLTQIDERASFFQGARLVLDIGSQALGVDEMSHLRDVLSERGISLWAVLSESPKTEKTAQLLGLATRLSKPRAEERRSPAVEAPGEDTALFVNRTLRSGTRIEFPGHVVVMGDVNPGAEVIAEGNVIVWGRVRGVIHAGAKGNRDAVICALDLSATQLRIANEISAVLKPQKNPRPEIASINKEGRLQSELWQPG